MYPISVYSFVVRENSSDPVFPISDKKLDCVIGSDDELVSFFGHVGPGDWHYKYYRACSCQFFIDLYGTEVSTNRLVHRLIEIGYAKDGYPDLSFRRSGKKRHKRYCGYRHPSTCSVNRDMCFFKYENIRVADEFGVRIKGRVRKGPSAWDDIQRSHSRSWKKYRKTQYR